MGVQRPGGGVLYVGSNAMWGGGGGGRGYYTVGNNAIYVQFKGG